MIIKRCDIKRDGYYCVVVGVFFGVGFWTYILKNINWTSIGDIILTTFIALISGVAGTLGKIVVNNWNDKRKLKGRIKWTQQK